MSKLLVVMVLAALCAVPVSAQNPIAQQTEPPAQTSTAAVEAPPASTSDQETTPETPEKQPPTIEELESKLDALTEAFTETRNGVDLLSKMKLSGYLQAQYVNDERSVNELTSATATRNLDQFSIRRARVKFTYQFLPTSRFVLQPDFPTSGSPSVKDVYVEFTEPWTTWKHTLTAGQFNWPFGFEITYSSSSREVPERSRVVRTLFPGERDRGVMLSGNGMMEKLKYQLALVNGTGTTQTFDTNKRKDLVGRVAYTFGPLDLGASHYSGEDLVTLNGLTRGREFGKTRTGVDFQLVTPITGLGLRGEYIVGEQPPAAGAPLATAKSADVKGWYFYAIQNIGLRHQLVVRIDEYDPNTNVANNAIRTINPSYVFHWDSHSKVMASYEMPKTQGADPDDNAFTLRYQYSF